MLRKLILRMVLPVLGLILSGCIKPGSDEILVTPYTKMDFPAEGNTSDFAISSNFLWTIEISDTWIVVNPMRGYGDRNITVTASANPNLTA
ncbi:MAG: BACON domain-containing protein, partial [Bacteroidales bacterium]